MNRWMQPTFKRWIADVNTTALKSVWAVILAVLTGLVTFAWLLLLAWLDRDARPGAINVYESWLLFLAALLGINALQFWSKRATDVDYMAAKQSGAPAPTAVVSRADTVTVAPPTPAAPAASPVAAPTAPPTDLPVAEVPDEPRSAE
jgi:hypothetical protein